MMAAEKSSKMKIRVDPLEFGSEEIISYLGEVRCGEMHGTANLERSGGWLGEKKVEIVRVGSTLQKFGGEENLVGDREEEQWVK